MRVRFLGQAQMRDRVALEAVGSALEDHELRPVALQMRFDCSPGLEKFAIAGTRRQWQVELRSNGCASTRLLAGPGARVQVAPVLVQIREYQRRIILKRVIDAVAMMRIDVDIGDPLEAMLPLQLLDDNTTIVEDTETGGMAARGMMQARNRYERPPGRACHQRVSRDQRTAYDITGGLIDAFPCRRVAGIQKSFAGQGTSLNQINIGRQMKHFELVPRCGARRKRLHAAVEALGCEFTDKRIVPVGSEGMAIAKGVARDALADDDAGTGCAAVRHRQKPSTASARPPAGGGARLRR